MQPGVPDLRTSDKEVSYADLLPDWVIFCRKAGLARESLGRDRDRPRSLFQGL